MRLKWCIFSGAVIVITIGLLGYGQLMRYADSPLLVTEDQLITIVPGNLRNQVLQLLQTQQLWTQGSRQFHWLCRLHPHLAQFKAGTYRVKPGMTLRMLLQQIQKGQEAQFALRFIEGLQYQEWLSIIQSAPYLQKTLGDRSATTVAQMLGIENLQIEGWLFPDTYYYTAGTTDVELLRRAYQRMRQQLMLIWQNRQLQLPLKSPYELLIMASLIEKEAANAVERPLIASVFMNRLQRGMRLQSDPTVIYGLGQQYRGVLSYSMLRQMSSHNTYQINGLPPTPIAMPGKASLQAAAHPAETNYLYFVVSQEGNHIFNQDFAEHCQAANAYRKSQRSVKSDLPLP